MSRVIFEFLMMIVVAFIARAVLTSVIRSLGSASRDAFRAQQQANSSAGQNAANSQAHPTGELHKDPVCGTYVAESTAFRRQMAGQTFFYCSEACREKHTLVAR